MTNMKIKHYSIISNKELTNSASLLLIYLTETISALLAFNEHHVCSKLEGEDNE